MEAETGEMLPEAKECPRPPEATRAFGGSMTLMLDFWTPELRENECLLS